MKRRRSSSRNDPVVQRATDDVDMAGFITLLEKLFETIGPREGRAVTQALNGMGIRGIADAEGVSVQTARNLLSAGLSKLRHPSRTTVLRDYLGADYERMLTRIETSVLRDNRMSERPLIHCKKHGWMEPTGQEVCLQCDCELPIPGLTAARSGRSRRYCSDACRQKGYRQKRNESTRAQ